MNRVHHLSDRVRSLIAGGAALVVLSALWTFLLHPVWLKGWGAIEQLHDAQFELGRARMVVSERDKISETAIVAEERALFQRLQGGNSVAAATGFLQGNVSQLAKDSGLLLESMSAEPLLLTEPLAKVSVVLKARGTEAALAKMLQALESAQNVMVVDRLLVSMQDGGQGAPGAGANGVLVEMRISAYWAPAQAPVKARP